MKYRIKVKVEFEECGDEADCGFEEVGQIVLSEAESISIDDVESHLLNAGYDSMRAAISDHLEAISKKKPGGIRHE